MKELGYDVKKNVNMSYKDCGGALLFVCNDQPMLDLTNQLSTHGFVDVYVEISEDSHDKNLP